MNYEAWLDQLRRAAVEGFYFSPEAAAGLAPEKRASWRTYYEEGYGPLAALEEDLATDGSGAYV